MIPKIISERVLVVGPDFKNHRGGIGEIIQSYAKEFEQFNFIPTYKYHSKNILKSIYFCKQAFKFVYYLINNRRIKIIHIHFSSYGSFFRKSLIVLLSKAASKKVIFHCNGSEFQLFYKNSGLLKYYIRYILRISNMIVCVSPQWKTFFNSIVYLKKIDIVNNPVAPSYFNKILSHKETIQFLFLGRVGERKGIFDLLRSITLLSDNKKNYMRLIVGGDGDISRLNETITNLKLQNVVFYKGWVTGKEKYDLLRTSDVYVLPSYNEGLPISILEAMSYGMPIISTPVGGIPEVVKDGENGFMNKPGDFLSLSNSLDRFISNQELLISFGKSQVILLSPIY